MVKTNWKKIFKKAFASKGSDPFKMELAPYRDWSVIAGVFFVGLVISLGFSIYMSIEINRDNFFGITSKTDQGAVLNKAGLEKVLLIFSEKEAIFEKTTTEKPPLVDPSL